MKSKASRPLESRRADFHWWPSTTRMRLRSVTSLSGSPVRGGRLRSTLLRTAWMTRPAQCIGPSTTSTTALKPAKRKKAPMPSSAACSRPRSIGVPAMIAGRTKMGRASRPPMPRTEMAVSPPTAVAGSLPEAASMRNCVAAPAAWPPGTTSEMALPASCEVATENQALVRRARRCRAMVQVKWATWATRATRNQSGLSDLQLRPRAEDRDQGREDEVDGDAGHQGGHRRLEHGAPRRRGRDVLLDAAGQSLRVLVVVADRRLRRGGGLSGWHGAPPGVLGVLVRRRWARGQARTLTGPGIPGARPG